MSWWSFRNALQMVHLWTGLILSLPFIILGVTGSILILQPVIYNLPVPHASARGDIQAPSRILAAAKLVAPKDRYPTRIMMPQKTGEPAMVGFAPDGARAGIYSGLHIYIDPVSLQPLATVVPQGPSVFLQKTRILHAILFLPTAVGGTIVGWSGILLAIVCLMGLVLWWPRKGQLRNAFIIRRNLRGFRLHRDVHNAFGIWTLIVLLVVGLTGVEYAMPELTHDAVGAFLSMERTAPAPAPAGKPVTGRVGPDEMVASALAAVPGTRFTIVDFPIVRGQSAVVTLATPFWGEGSPPITVLVDPKSAAVTYVDDPRTYPLGEQALTWMKILHGGQGLGEIWEALVFLSGFLPLLFAVTGFSMWWLKRRQRRAVGAVEMPDASGVPAE